MSETIGHLLAVGNVAEIFEWGSYVVKLYKSTAAKPMAFREAAINAAVEAIGLPVPRVWGVQEIGGRWGIVFDRVKQASFGEQILNNSAAVRRYLECMVNLHLRIHAHSAIQFAGLKFRLAANIAATRLLDERRKLDFLDGLSNMPDGDRLCHGDFHPMNILGETSQPVIIDWADARRGDPAADAPADEVTCRRNCDALSRRVLQSSRYGPTSRAQLVTIRRSCQVCRRCSKRTRWLAEDYRIAHTQLSPRPIAALQSARRRRLTLPTSELRVVHRIVVPPQTQTPVHLPGLRVSGRPG
ncbi:MAG: aminoglycoside phosphotransferase family protein [Stellaceae bacterium]